MVTTEDTSTKATKQEMPYSQKAKLVNEILENYGFGLITTVECLSQISTLPWNPLEMVAITKILQDSIKFNPYPLKSHIQ